MNKKVKSGISADLDQYYTNPVYAQGFFDVVKATVSFDKADILLEPSAGTGNFFNLFDTNKRVGLDLDPKCNGVLLQDFLTWRPDLFKTVYTIGNPPFGRNANLAIKFFNHAAKFSSVIAFILPKTFRKASVINRLNRYFHLIHDKDTPPNSFIFNNAPYDVWCCEQIWIRKTEKREKIPIFKVKDFATWFEIVEPSKADFAIQRVGGKAGLIRINDIQKYSSQSHYFIKQHRAEILDIFKQLDFEDIKHNTAKNPSISPSELVERWQIKAKEIGFL